MRSRSRVSNSVFCMTAVMLLNMCSQPAPPPRGDPPARSSEAGAPRVVLPDGSAVHVELATDQTTRAQGLMFRDRLRPNTGMLFIFPEVGGQSFWMKNTLIPLDIIFLDAEGRVKHVSHDTPPCKADPCPSYPPNAVPALYVLEVAGGVARQHGISEGAVLKLEGIENVVVR